MNFTATVQLAKLSSRAEETIAKMKNDPSLGIYMQMTVLKLSPSSDNKSIVGKIQLEAENLKTNFIVIAPSEAHIKYFASRFNMCSYHDCDIKFEIIQPAFLKITYYPPSSEVVVRRLKKFFEHTSISNA